MKASGMKMMFIRFCCVRIRIRIVLCAVCDLSSIYNFPSTQHSSSRSLSLFIARAPAHSHTHTHKGAPMGCLLCYMYVVRDCFFFQLLLRCHGVWPSLYIWWWAIKPFHTILIKHASPFHRPFPPAAAVAAARFCGRCALPGGGGGGGGSGYLPIPHCFSAQRHSGTCFD